MAIEKLRNIDIIKLWEDTKKLDINYITEHLTPLCELKESPEIIDKLQNIIKDIL